MPTYSTKNRNDIIYKKLVANYHNEALDKIEAIKLDKELYNLLSEIAIMKKVTVYDMCLPTRKREICEARQLAFTIIYESGYWSLVSVGKMFTVKVYDHTTIMHACKIVHDLIKQDPEFNEIYLRAKASFKMAKANQLPYPKLTSRCTLPKKDLLSRIDNRLKELA